MMSHFISVVLHPLLLPTYIVILLGYFSPLSISPLNTLEGRTFLIGLIFLSSFFLPFLLIVLYIMIKEKQWSINSFLMQESKSRVFPFLLIGIFYTMLVYFIRLSPQINNLIAIIMSCITISILLLTLISNFYKISAHATGISGMIGLLAVVNNKAPDSTLFYPLIVLIFLAGCLISARLFVNSHTPNQVLSGIFLGLCSGLSCYFFI